MLRRAAAQIPHRTIPLKDTPSVTVFTSSMNTRDPLKLTLSSLQKCTDYPDYRIIVGENGSSDGSAEWLTTQSESAGSRLRVMNNGKPRPHGEWLDAMYRDVETPYWFAVDSDMWFFAKDWLVAMLRIMEACPNMYLLGAEPRPATPCHVEPIGGETIDSGEALCSWLFCIRTSLRDRLTVPFSFTVDSQNPTTGRKFCYDTGGKLISEMRQKGISYATMPRLFTLKYFHFANLSWGLKASVAHTPWGALKAYQLRHISAQVSTL